MIVCRFLLYNISFCIKYIHGGHYHNGGREKEGHINDWIAVVQILLLLQRSKLEIIHKNKKIRMENNKKNYSIHLESSIVFCF